MMNVTSIRNVFLALPLTAVLFTAGCKKPIDDATLTTNVQNALASDAAIAKQPITVSVQGGNVTLSGNVSDDTASTVAAQDAAKVLGVKEVVNSLQIAGVDVAPTVVTPAAPSVARATTPAERTAIAAHQPLPAPVENAPPPPQPTYRDVSVPAGTSLPIRINQTLDSETTEEGTSFSGVVTREVIADGMVVIPAGSSVSGRVVGAHEAGHYKGHSLLSIRLTAVNRHGHSIPISTDSYTVEGKNRGKNSAEKIGGGAAVGAILGGIFGGGKGAAIGAAAGGGGGAAVQGFTRGQQVSIPSESVIRFRLTDPFTVRTAENPSNYEPPARPVLQTR
ncbi:MAG TPA: BON domain-containing protein [Acidobacteriaceae bacterium]|jgi:hypothetical protein